MEKKSYLTNADLFLRKEKQRIFVLTRVGRSPFPVV